MEKIQTFIKKKSKNEYMGLRIVVESLATEFLSTPFYERLPPSQVIDVQQYMRAMSSEQNSLPKSSYAPENPHHHRESFSDKRIPKPQYR